MFAVPRSAVPREPAPHREAGVVGSDDSCFLGFGRVFCGTLRPGQSLYIIPVRGGCSVDGPPFPHVASALGTLVYLSVPTHTHTSPPTTPILVARPRSMAAT